MAFLKENLFLLFSYLRKRLRKSQMIFFHYKKNKKPFVIIALQIVNFSKYILCFVFPATQKLFILSPLPLCFFP